MVIVRRRPGRERGVVMLNGSKVSVDVEELPEAEIKSLSKQKRVKPPRIPLDQPPVLGVIRWRHRDRNGEGEEPGTDPPSSTKREGISESWSSTWSGAVRKFRSLLGRYFMGDETGGDVDAATCCCYLPTFIRGRPGVLFLRISPTTRAQRIAVPPSSAFAIRYRLGRLDAHLRKGLPVSP
jgi:hypothetical protein